MRRLHLLRHAKSSWDDDAVPDHERPLAPRGRRAVPLLAGWIAANDVHPEVIHCSTALRARESLDGLLAALGDPPTLFDPQLYHASAQALLEHIRSLPEIAETMIVGHNPGLQRVAVLLSSPSPERYRVAEKLPTGALVTIELDVDRWDDVDVGCGRITALVLPRELA